MESKSYVTLLSSLELVHFAVRWLRARDQPSALSSILWYSVTLCGCAVFGIFTCWISGRRSVGIVGGLWVSMAPEMVAKRNNVCTTVENSVLHSPTERFQISRFPLLPFVYIHGCAASEAAVHISFNTQEKKPRYLDCVRLQLNPLLTRLRS